MLGISKSLTLTRAFSNDWGFTAVIGTVDIGFVGGAGRGGGVDGGAWYSAWGGAAAAGVGFGSALGGGGASAAAAFGGGAGAPFFASPNYQKSQFSFSMEEMCESDF